MDGNDVTEGEEPRAVGDARAPDGKVQRVRSRLFVVRGGPSGSPRKRARGGVLPLGGSFRASPRASPRCSPPDPAFVLFSPQTDAAAPPIDAKAKRNRRRGGLLPPPALHELIDASPRAGGERDARAETNDDAADAAATTRTETAATATSVATAFPESETALKVSEEVPGSSPGRGTADGSSAPELEPRVAERDDEKTAADRDDAAEDASSSAEGIAKDFEARVAEAVAKALEAKALEAKALEAKALEAKALEDAKGAASVRAGARAAAKPGKPGRLAARETDGFRREIDGLKKDLEKQKERCASFEAKFKAATKERAAATAERADVEKELRRAETRAEAAGKLSERREKASEQKHERLATQLEERKGACAAAEREARRLAALANQAERDRDDARAARDASDAALEPLRASLAAARREAEEATRRADLAAEAAEASGADAAAARAEMCTLDAVRRELEEARAEAAAATAARVARDGVVGAELRDAQRRLAEWCASTAETELELERTKETLNEMSEKLSAASDANESLREKRAAAEMDAADARAALSKAAAARDEAEAALARTEREGSPARAAEEALRRTLRDAEAALLASREETAALSASFRETEGILEEAVGRAEEETGARRALELALENRASSEQARLAALDDALASERRLVAERTAEVSHLERRAVRAEDRLRETERQLAKARAEAAVGVALSAPPPGAGPFAPSAEETPRRQSGVGANEGASSETTDALGTATRLPTTTNEGASSLRLELKARTRQTHKLQEVCAGLKRRFVDQGGSASAFELGKDVCEARYELKACEQKRLAERERAEQLARELEKTRRALASLEANGLAGAGWASNALAARGANADNRAAANRRHSRGEGKQINGILRAGVMMTGNENAA